MPDLAAGGKSLESLLVQIGAPRLRALGIEPPDASPNEDPEMALYTLLVADTPDGAHSRYNALVRALVSFERAAESVAR